MGRKLVLTGTKITDLAAPRIADVDRIEAAGSLLLLDATHPVQTWGAGVPANASTVPNLLVDKASTLLGTSSAASHNPPVASARMTDGVHGMLERTSRGGLHAIFSPTNTDNATANSTYFNLNLTLAQRDYLAANPTNSIYASMWVRITRGATGSGGTNAVMAMTATSSATANLWMYFGQNGIGGATDKTTVAWKTPDATGTHLAVGAGPYKSGTGYTPASGANIAAYAFQVGNQGYINSAAPTNAPSAVFYRAYMEDLTVSGRTYADVLAIDQELYTHEVLTEGGRYYGDSFTDPATVA